MINISAGDQLMPALHPFRVMSRSLGLSMVSLKWNQPEEKRMRSVDQRNDEHVGEVTRAGLDFIHSAGHEGPMP